MPGPIAIDDDTEVAVHKFNGASYESAQKCMEACLDAKLKGHAPYWKLLEPTVIDGVVKLLCQFCKRPYSCSNVPRFCKDHFKDNFESCVVVGGKSRKRERDLGVAAASANKKSSAVQKSIADCVVTGKQRDLALQALSMFWYTNPTVSCSLIDDPYLRQAFAYLGLKDLPDRKKLSTTRLDRTYEEFKCKLLKDVFGADCAAEPSGSSVEGRAGPKTIPIYRTI
jgi:hypothetical protein